MLGLGSEATLVTVSTKAEDYPNVSGWTFKAHDFLLKEIDELIKTKSIGGSVMYVVLLALAMLAIFDTQVFAIFRRRKEIGTFIALGMTRFRVVRMFTIEGAMHGVLAAVLAAVYGIPFLWWQAEKGFGMPEMAGDMGIVISERIFPVYSIGLITGTTAIVMITVIVVSFLPSRKIARMKPTQALKGKMVTS